MSGKNTEHDSVREYFFLFISRTGDAITPLCDCIKHHTFYYYIITHLIFGVKTFIFMVESPNQCIKREPGVSHPNNVWTSYSLSLSWTERGTGELQGAVHASVNLGVFWK